jgi:hypothetical protein
MSLILLGTIISGLLFSKVLLMANLENMVVRYPIVVLTSYLLFFAFIRVWLFYIRNRQEAAENAVDTTADILSNIDIPEPKIGFEFGGGEFGGGGASGSFGEIGASSVLESSSSGVGDIAGEAGGSLLEEGGIILIPLILILAAIFGVGILLIYEAPVILSEAAFEFVLAGVLVKKAKEIDSPEWIGSVFKNTWKPFIFTLFLAVILSTILSHFFPEAIKLSQVFI